ncbi:Bis-triphosphatase [Mytilinidion resinicola]|uniref:Bis(5'-adenosyl)-triphosphatase n=1 Tax=Mytilinidion resinicola TaxID=574789 RepID=A0A6A6YA31_9PEZI|nr:Bis-triphosphatase [Mytilinidion resinicola]KAF2805418.1 Bis-triphosphatase [Mytilinidion resinicola]
MPPLTTKSIHFGSFLVTSQVFHLTPSSFALVNLKPLLPGHVLVSPIRVVPRFNDLTPSEVTDLFLTVQSVSRMVERVFKASAINIAIQDGADAGQSVPHVHAHIIPRSSGDLNDRGGQDAIYGMMEGEEGDLGRQLKERDAQSGRAKFPAVDADESRKPRSDEEMTKEAEWLAQEMEKE